MGTIEYIIASLLLIVAFIIALIAQIKVESTYNRYSKIESKSGLTGGQLAQKIIDSAGLDVKVNVIKGKLSDNYDSSNGVLNISSTNYNSKSVAALGVVAHECGHAIQDAKDYKPLRIRHHVIKTTNIASKFLLPLLILGLIFDLMYIGGITGMVFIWTAVCFYALSVLVNLATLPVEINASSRALKMLEGFEIMDDEELRQSRKVLSAAALTYLASLLISLAYFMRFLLFALSRLNDR